MSDFRDYLNEQLKDPEFKKEWDKLEPEFNMMQDVAAARVVMQSEAPFVQLPCMGIVSSFTVSAPELEYWLVGKNPVADYLAKNTINAAERYASGKPWTIGIDRPVDGNNTLGADLQGVFRIPSGAYGVVTSGNYRKYYIKDGKKYAHTIDPRTGYPVDHSLLSATVIAPDAMTADAYATYCMVVGLEASKEFFAGRTDMEACLIYDEGGEFRTWCTPGFHLEE